MRISVGSDHRGLEVKNRVVDLLVRLGHEVTDEGTQTTDSVDYPDVAITVSRKVCNGQADRGILVCGTGIGMSITANKLPGIRAATCNDSVTAEISRRHNDVNVLCLAGDFLGQKNIDRLIEVWIDTKFEGGRHARRLKKIAELERNGSDC